MQDYILLRPTREYSAQIMQYRKEFLDAGNSMDGCGPLRRAQTPEEYIKLCTDYENPHTVPAHLVPAVQFLFIRKRDNRLLGMIQIRHPLNEYCTQYAGHIGYSIRPVERCKGYAKIMLGMTLPICCNMGLNKVLILCVDGNISSEKTILRNGGVYESTIHEPDKNIELKRFWINL